MIEIHKKQIATKALQKKKKKGKREMHSLVIIGI
jgi:hypothetical protein